MPASLPAIAGHQLIRLLQLDGWQIGGRRTHGVRLSKMGEDGHMRFTVIADKSEPLAAGTLAAILGPKETGIGRAGLADLIAVYGLH